MKIALLAGDGIGPEIMREAVRVLDVLRREGLKIETEEAFVGGCAYDAHGDPLPPKTLELAKKADAVLFGAVGSPRHDKLPRDKRPEKAIELAVKGMLPHNKLARQIIKKLKVYPGAEHPHAAQQPKPFEITQIAQ